MSAAAERRPMSARAEKSIRLSVTGILSAPTGLIGIATRTEWLGYVTVGIILVGILLGPVIERMRAS